MLISILIFVFVVWVFSKMLLWTLRQIPLFARSEEEGDYDAEKTRNDNLIGLYHVRKKDGNVAGADQVEAELRERRVEGWYHPASAKHSDEQ